MTDRGLKILYVYENPPKVDLHDGIDCIKRKFLVEFLDRPGLRYFDYVLEEDIVLTEEEWIALGSRIVKGY